MADFTTCDTVGYSVETILASMFSELDSDTNVVGFRVINKTGETIEAHLECKSFETWKELFRKALEIDKNGMAALRIILSEDANSLASCGDQDTPANMFRRSFVELSDGTVALLLFESSIS